MCLETPTTTAAGQLGTTRTAGRIVSPAPPPQAVVPSHWSSGATPYSRCGTAVPAGVRHFRGNTRRARRRRTRRNVDIRITDTGTISTIMRMRHTPAALVPLTATVAVAYVDAVAEAGFASRQPRVKLTVSAGSVAVCTLFFLDSASAVSSSDQATSRRRLA